MSAGRRWRDSIWLVSTLVFGVTTWAGFLYIGAVARRPKWLVAAAVYLAGAVAVLVINSKPRATATTR